MKKVSLFLSSLLAVALIASGCILNNGQAGALAPNQTPLAATTVSSTPTLTETTGTTATTGITATTATTATMASTITATSTMPMTGTTSVTGTMGTVTVTQAVSTPLETTTPTATSMITVAPGTADVFRTISTIKGLETLNSALIATNIVSELDVTTRTFTIFAPTNQAFAAMPAALRERAMANPATLRNILLYHVVVDRVTQADLLRLGSALTALGENVIVTNTGISGTVRVNNATIIQPDIPASNGLIHIINAVLLPASVLAGTNALTSTGTTTATGSMTSTSPVTSTGTATVGTGSGVKIITTDVSGLTMAQVISSTPSLKTLGVALQAAGMTTTLSGTGPLTLFAPTNQAFASLPPATLSSLLNTPTSLVSVLQYHTVADRVTAADLARLGVALSTQGSPITVTVAANGVVSVNNATIVQSDIVASNGIIHLINAVLMPPTK